jgi:hypothetical protein
MTAGPSFSLSRLLSDYSNAHKEPPDAPLPLSRQSKTNQLFFFFRLSADCAELPSCSLSDRPSFSLVGRALNDDGGAHIPPHTSPRVRKCLVAPQRRPYKDASRFVFFSWPLPGVTRTHFERLALYRLALAHCCLFEAP